MTQYQAIWQLCPVCRCPLHEEEGKKVVALVGAKKYGYCPKCGEETEEKGKKDRNYRRRVDRYLEKARRAS